MTNKLKKLRRNMPQENIPKLNWDRITESLTNKLAKLSEDKDGNVAKWRGMTVGVGTIVVMLAVITAATLICIAHPVVPIVFAAFIAFSLGVSNFLKG